MGITDALLRAYGLQTAAGNTPRKRRRRPKRQWTNNKPGPKQANTQGSNHQNSNPRKPSHNPFVSAGGHEQTVIAYHGTPTLANAADILRNGFLVGSGNACGDGVYMSVNMDEAKRYGAYYLKCNVRLGRCCHWNAGIERQFNDWCRKHAVRADNSAKTSFLLKQGYHSLRANTILVILMPQFANPSAHKVRPARVRILGVFRSDNNQKQKIA